MNFPSRIQNVGNLKCVFLSFYYNGKYPIVSIGPHWRFTIALIIFSFLCQLYCFVLLSYISFNKCPIGCLLSGFLSFINLLLMYATILCEPGVPASVYLRYCKHN